MTEVHPDGRILSEQRGHLLLIDIDRPEERNGFTPKMFDELAAAYSLLERTHELRCGVLYADGDHFTAGLDMPKIAPLRQQGNPLLLLTEVDPFNLREPIRTKPMVVAVKGVSFTLAIELMPAADVAIAADNCRFFQLEVKRGIMASCGATFRIAERIAQQAPLAVQATMENARVAMTLAGKRHERRSLQPSSAYTTALTRKRACNRLLRNVRCVYGALR